MVRETWCVVGSCVVATWNVLHWVHAKNHGEVPAWLPNEARRARAVVDRICAIDVNVWCLQEVSGNTLSLIRKRFPPGMVHWHQFPRIPRLRNGLQETCVEIGAEYLVTIAQGFKVNATHFHGEEGKGYLAVELAVGGFVLNTHVSFEPDKRNDQLTQLEHEASPHRGRAVLCGDFNCEIGDVLAGLSAAWKPTRRASADMYSRPASRGGGGQNIDHILYDSPGTCTAEILDAEGLSDHNIVVSKPFSQ